MGLRDAKKEQTRMALIQIGMELYLRQGFPTTTVDQITTAANVAKGTFYNYFATKEDLLVAGMLHAQGDEAERQRTAVFQLPTTRERLVSVVSCSLQWTAAYPELTMIWCQERLRRGVEATNSGFDHLLAEVIRAGQETGDLRTDRRADQICLDVEGILLAHVASWYHTGATFDLARAVTDALDIYLTGAQNTEGFQ